MIQVNRARVTQVLTRLKTTDDCHTSDVKAGREQKGKAKGKQTLNNFRGQLLSVCFHPPAFTRLVHATWTPWSLFTRTICLHTYVG